MMLKQTKIVASISDLRCDVDFIRELFFLMLQEVCFTVKG